MASTTPQPRMKLTELQNWFAALIGGGIVLMMVAFLLSSAQGGSNGVLDIAMLIGIALLVFGAISWAFFTRPWQDFDDWSKPLYTGHAHDTHSAVADDPHAEVQDNHELATVATTGASVSTGAVEEVKVVHARDTHDSDDSNTGAVRVAIADSSASGTVTNTVANMTGTSASGIAPTESPNETDALRVSPSSSDRGAVRVAIADSASTESDSQPDSQTDSESAKDYSSEVRAPEAREIVTDKPTDSERAALPNQYADIDSPKSDQIDTATDEPEIGAIPQRDQIGVPAAVEAHTDAVMNAPTETGQANVTPEEKDDASQGHGYAEPPVVVNDKVIAAAQTDAGFVPPAAAVQAVPPNASDTNISRTEAAVEKSNPNPGADAGNAAPIMDSTAASATATDSSTVSATKKDDLLKIEGIGPKINAALNAAGITTFQDLHSRPAAEVESIVRNAGVRMVGNAGTWADQARLASEGKWAELQTLQQSLTSSRKG